MAKPSYLIRSRRWEDRMPTRRERDERRLRDVERITNRIREPADRLFDGDPAKGLLYWAAELHLYQTANTPTEDDLLSNITDGKDDLELDAYYVDDDALAVYLFQSKYRSSPGNLKMGDLASFLDVPNKLATPQMLAQVSNEKVLEFAPIFRRRLLDGYELHLVYLTTLRTTKPLQARADAWTEGLLTLPIGGEYIDIPHSVTLMDIDNLIRVIDSLNEIREIELTLRIDPSGHHETKSGELRCLVATLRLEELAMKFDEYKYAIFRYNPRGPLGSVAVNKDIKQTLEDPNRRELFQLMNNGLSAVCTAFVVSNDDMSVNVRGFQVVNGCQTTYNVYDHWRRGGELGDATVTLKLIEDPSSNLRYLVSSSSNKQSQMKDWDFLFDEAEQSRLQDEFKALDPPLFYELRRGEHKYISGGGISEKTTVKDIAQTMWAFVGRPGEAKDRLREIPRSKSIMSGAYRDVFSPGIEAERLRLPWLIYGRVQQEWKKYSDATGNQGDEREHGRLHILWLVGRSVLGSQDVSRYEELPLGKVKWLAETLDDWFEDHHRIAVDAITYVVDVKRGVALEAGQTLSLRQLFRSAGHYDSFTQRHDKLIRDELALGNGLAVA